MPDHEIASLLRNERFPRSSQYDPEWQIDGAYGGNSLWLAEWLCEDLELKSGMNVLDLGCGRAKSSIFLAKEFGVNVWATDLWNSPEDNQPRVGRSDVASRVTCVQAEANKLPFEFGFFDAILALDSIQYYGTDTLFLPYIIQFLKPRGILGFASAGMVEEVRHPVPKRLQRFWVSDCWCLRSAAWWREHWERTGLVDVQLADTMEDGWRRWIDWYKAIGCAEWGVTTLEEDAGTNLGYIRAIARRAEGSPDLTYDLRTGKEQGKS